MDEYAEGPKDDKVFYHCELVVNKEEE